jgi:hypothetical protein
MNPLKVSAQFAAYAWYSDARQGRAPRDEAVRFAEENWVTFLPWAHEGWGKLLIRVAQSRRAEGGRGRGTALGRREHAASGRAPQATRPAAASCVGR